MTNEELWEWMQRDLDGDLSPEEQQILYSLIRKDSELQLMYNRLKTVSQQLEQLPPVVPSISIVDSILPQLESAAAIPAAKTNLNEEILPTLEVLRKPSQTSEPKKWKRMKVWLASIGSTAVAACLLVGVLFMANDGNKQELDPYQQGAEIAPPATEKSAFIGPPAPPPSTNPSQSTTPGDEKKPEDASSQVKKQSAKTPTKPVKQKPASNPNTKPAATNPAVATKPVPQEPKPPAFPIGLEEKSDSDDNKIDRDDEKDNKDDKDEKKDNDKGKVNKRDKENDD